MHGYDRPADLLADLVRFETVNPPGEERECIEFVEGLLADAGLETKTLARDPERPNLLARLPGGDAPPLLLYGHVDVVPVEGQEWTHPPFAGVIEDGYVWGRGTLDMKGGVTMMLWSVLRAASEGLTPAGDVIFAALSDEEAGGEYGAEYLVENHPEEFDGVEYALGEFGGYPMHMGEATVYPIQVAEKGICWLDARVTGPGGHASRPQRDGTMATLARTLDRLTSERLPARVTPAAEAFAEGVADAVADDEAKRLLSALCDPETTDEALDAMADHPTLAEHAGRLDAMFHNTVSPTVVEGGSKVNVHPSDVRLRLDGRVLPGVDAETFLAEVRDVADDEDVEFSVARYDESVADVDTGLFDLLGGVIESNVEGATAVPFLLTAGTDGRFFDRLGVQTYGYTPMNLPPDFEFQSLAHNADERIPVESVAFGADAIYQVLEGYDGGE